MALYPPEHFHPTAEESKSNPDAKQVLLGTQMLAGTWIKENRPCHRPLWAVNEDLGDIERMVPTNRQCDPERGPIQAGLTEIGVQNTIENDRYSLRGFSGQKPVCSLRQHQCTND